MEVWREIRDHPGYHVSNLGRVRSVDRWVQYSDGRKARFKGRMLKPGNVGAGYLQVSLGGSAPNQYVQQLVAVAFIGKPPPGQEIRHIDGKPNNNRADNLIYGTKSENQTDRIAHGTHGRGERNPAAKLTEEAVREIRGDIPVMALMKKYGICRSRVYAIRNRESWGWL